MERYEHFNIYDELVIFLPSFDSPGNQRWGVCYESKYVACKDSLIKMHACAKERTRGTFQDGVQSSFMQVIFCTLLIEFSKIHLIVTIESRGLSLFIWS